MERSAVLAEAFLVIAPLNVVEAAGIAAVVAEKIRPRSSISTPNEFSPAFGKNLILFERGVIPPNELP